MVVSYVLTRCLLSFFIVDLKVILCNWITSAATFIMLMHDYCLFSHYFYIDQLHQGRQRERIGNVVLFKLVFTWICLNTEFLSYLSSFCYRSLFVEWFSYTYVFNRWFFMFSVYHVISLLPWNEFDLKISAGLTSFSKIHFLLVG